MLVGFLIAALLARYYPVESIGLYFLALLLIQLFVISGSTTSGMNALRFLNGQPVETRDEMCRGVIAYTLLFAAALSALGAGATWIASHFIAIGNVDIFYAAFAAGSMQLAANSIQNCLLATRRQYSAAWMLMATEIVRLVLTILVADLKLGIEWQIAALAGSRLITVTLFTAVYRQSLLPKFSSKINREFFIDGFFNQTASITSLISSRVFDVAVISFSGLAEFGLYSIAAQIPSQMQRLLEAFRNPIGQLIAGRKLSPEFAVRWTGFAGLFFCILTTQIICFSELIVTLVYGQKYAPIAFSLQILSVATTTGVQNYLVAIFMLMSGQSRNVAISGSAFGVAGLVACLLLVPSFGNVGAAWAVLAGQFASLCCNVAFYNGLRFAIGSAAFKRLYLQIFAIISLALVNHAADFSLLVRFLIDAAMSIGFMALILKSYKPLFQETNIAQGPAVRQP
jgi:O-antigen/teichoic acid export membrane protein